MEIKSHILLGEYLLNNISYFSSAHRKVFILGCVTPDINMFSYLRGSLKYRRFRGHNYTSSKNYTARELNKLQNRRSWNLRDSYRLGKVIHYLSDSFTYPHNDSFKGTLAQHRLYESRLHSYLKEYLKQHCRKDDSGSSEGEASEIDELRKKYEKNSGEIPYDAIAVTQSASYVMTSMSFAGSGNCMLSTVSGTSSAAAFEKQFFRRISDSLTALRRRILSHKAV